jgi:hypothetical protein
VIVRDEGDRLILVRQADHALLSGWLAAAWGAPPWAEPEPRLACVLAARLHDIGWTPLDETMPMRADGRPLAFHEVDRAVTTRLYASGLDGLEALNAHAALLSSLHFSGFFTSHWGWQHGYRPERLSETTRRAVESFVEHERARQVRLRGLLGLGPAEERQLMCDYFWLQLWDRISLDICRHGFTGWTAEYPPTPTGTGPQAGEVSLRIVLAPGGTCLLAPYPLVVSPYRARVPAVRVPFGTATGAGDPRRAWQGCDVDGIDVTFRSG